MAADRGIARGTSPAQARRRHRHQNAQLRQLEPDHPRDGMVRVSHPRALQLFYAANAGRNSAASQVRITAASVGGSPADERFALDGRAQEINDSSPSPGASAQRRISLQA